MSSYYPAPATKVQAYSLLVLLINDDSALYIVDLVFDDHHELVQDFCLRRLQFKRSHLYSSALRKYVWVQGEIRSFKCIIAEYGHALRRLSVAASNARARCLDVSACLARCESTYEDCTENVKQATRKHQDAILQRDASTDTTKHIEGLLNLPVSDSVRRAVKQSLDERDRFVRECKSAEQVLANARKRLELTKTALDNARQTSNSVDEACAAAVKRETETSARIRRTQDQVDHLYDIRPPLFYVKLACRKTSRNAHYNYHKAYELWCSNEPDILSPEQCRDILCLIDD